ncbi:hypothetical protein RHGRI_015167 [Rhododendron griersonianum]|uniref:F-box domain-containing protein n=1 Tax=Rhododendron griersonianum TaxID=479676 RepID=A0AAV6KCA9_9ERIC|nr:hypothetical protein RHGRI_015167 [Rhododendron griersonianum]
MDLAAAPLGRTIAGKTYWPERLRSSLLKTNSGRLLHLRHVHLQKSKYLSFPAPVGLDKGAVLNGRAGRKNYKLVPCSKKKKASSESYLPDELIFYILVWLPAHVLYNSTRYVCRQWYKIIHDPLFCKEQLLHSSTGLLLQDHHVPHIAQFAEFGEMSATLTGIKFMFPSWVLSTCNGLVLFCNPHDPSTLHVANPLTKQTVTVPPFKCHPGSCISFACAYSKMGYKVLCTYGPEGEKHNCVMLTLGKDHAWKPINRQKMSDQGWSMIKYRPFSVGQFIYWANRREKSVVVLDVESELFNEFRSPAVLTWRNPTSISYLRRGRTLSCLLMTECRSLMDVLVLSDPISGSQLLSKGRLYVDLIPVNLLKT